MIGKIKKEKGIRQNKNRKKIKEKLNNRRNHKVIKNKTMKIFLE